MSRKSASSASPIRTSTSRPHCFAASSHPCFYHRFLYRYFAGHQPRSEMTGISLMVTCESRDHLRRRSFLCAFAAGSRDDPLRRAGAGRERRRRFPSAEAREASSAVDMSVTIQRDVPWTAGSQVRREKRTLFVFSETMTGNATDPTEKISRTPTLWEGGRLECASRRARSDSL